MILDALIFRGLKNIYASMAYMLQILDALIFRGLKNTVF